MMDEDVLNRAAAATGDRAKAVASAFVALSRRSWPSAKIVDGFVAAERAPSAVETCKALFVAFDRAHEEHPSAMFWWKDEGSHFLGFCPRFAAASGVAAPDLFGLTDLDPGIAWSRQGALYMRDDREVVTASTPRFDILERQDREGAATVWLRTSKVPYRCAAGVGTVGGFDTISAAEAHALAKRARA